MKKFLCPMMMAVALSFTITTALSQKKAEPEIEIPKFTLEEGTGKVVYKEVVEQKGAPGALYDKALAWAMKYYNNPSNVLREKDREKGNLKAIARFYTYYTDPKKGTKTRMGTIEYTLSFQFKDGRYRYEITSINVKAQSYQGIEQWIEGNEKQYNYATASYLVQIDEELRNLINDFKTTIAKPEKVAEDW